MADRQSRFKVGDEVRLVPGTLQWGTHSSLHEIIGRVTFVEDDATSTNCIDVEFGGKRVFASVPEGAFEPA